MPDQPTRNAVIERVNHARKLAAESATWDARKRAMTYSQPGQRTKDEEIVRLRQKLRNMRKQVRDQQRAILLRNAAITQITVQVRVLTEDLQEARNLLTYLGESVEKVGP